MGAAFAAGADAMEIAVPNPPLAMDGPLLQEAAVIAAREVEDAADALRLAALGRGDGDGALIALVNGHAAAMLGRPRIHDVCVEAGVDALLTPEDSFAEQLESAAVARARGLEQLLFLHREEDLALLASTTLEQPMVYLQSADLRTGGPFNPEKARERLAEVRAALGGRDAYVLVGFGIRSSEEVAELAESVADGAVVGTALTSAAKHGPDEVADLVRAIVPALRRPVEKSSA